MQSFISLVVLPVLAQAATAAAATQTINATVYSLPTQISTVTIAAIDATATTFVYPCLDSHISGTTSILTPTVLWKHGYFDVVPGPTNSSSVAQTTPSPTTTGVPSCAPFTFTQGPSTWAMSFSIPNVVFSGGCTIASHGGAFPETQKNCSSSYSSAGGALSGSSFNTFTQDLVGVTAVADSGKVTLPTSATHSPTPTSTSTHHSGMAGIARPTDAAAMVLGLGGAAYVVAAAFGL